MNIVSTWLGVMCGMKDGTGWGATRALFAALEVDWPSVGGTFANLEMKFSEDKNNNEPKEAHPFPGLRTGFVAAVCKITLGVEEWEPENRLIKNDLLNISFYIQPFPNCLGRVVPRAAATAFLPELVENLDDVSIVALMVCVAEGADAAPGWIIIIMQV